MAEILPVKNCIAAWESIMANKGLLSPSMHVIIQSTIEYLKKVLVVKENENATNAIL